MEDNIKATELKNKKQKKRILRILEKSGTNNIYLLEGLFSENPNHQNLLLYQQNTLIAVVNLRFNKYIHAQSFTNNQSFKKELGIKLKTMYSNIKSIFGDKNSIDILEYIYSGRIDKTMNYIFMELTKDRFKPANYYDYPNISKENFNISPDIYPGIVSLQIAYETEELKTDLLKLKKEIITKLVNIRLARGKITVLQINNTPIGIAAINARYKNVCQIGSVYIDKHYRRKGYGLLLLSEHIKKLFNNYNKVVLFVRTNNGAAYNLYKKLGFIVRDSLEQIVLKDN